MIIKRILYIGFQHEFGNERNGHAINYKAWYLNFRDLGYEVEGVFYDGKSPEQLKGNLLSVVETFRPDMVFAILQSDQISPETLQALMKAGCYIVGFFGDDHWRYDGFTRNFVNMFDACITTDRYSIAKYRRDGQKNVVYSQWGSLDSSIEYEGVAYEYDISFVGGTTHYREWFVNELGKRGLVVKCFGDGWPAGRLTYEEMERVFSVSKINLNLSNSINYDARFLASSPRGLASTLKATLRGGGKNSSQIKARNFEIPTQGGFQITDYVPTLEEYFDVGGEIACYSSIDDAEKQIRYFLEYPEEREAIKIRGVERARACHTYKMRIRAFMGVLQAFREEKRGWVSQTVGSLGNGSAPVPSTGRKGISAQD